jgi:hypothetical protein
MARIVCQLNRMGSFRTLLLEQAVVDTDREARSGVLMSEKFRCGGAPAAV